ncbi:helix-turn-helix domain-containing protein [Novosphingobium sp. MBES04]|uniref:helix-turn-helix domain-containing protein n=1 Tax=Novosphingobium sp. MBES04 TaxID=1206458 RepID=UPI00057F97C4|nr:DUF4019 domain-containing protein [Novosphingobium sp. MBES04]
MAEGDLQDGYAALTEREKETLRLMARGHDAKSLARHFELSVHTIHERLRNARRKMAVSSSREAARLLLDREEGLGADSTPKLQGDTEMGAAPGPDRTADREEPKRASKTRPLLVWALGGVLAMTLAIVAALLMLSPSASLQSAPEAHGVESAPVASARAWLHLVDEGEWEKSWAETGEAFQAQNTAARWASLAAQVRPPLGEVVSRRLLGEEAVPGPPSGLKVVKFQSAFAHKANVIETVSLSPEEGRWKVVGYWMS